MFSQFSFSLTTMVLTAHLLQIHLFLIQGQSPVWKVPPHGDSVFAVLPFLPLLDALHLSLAFCSLLPPTFLVHQPHFRHSVLLSHRTGARLAVLTYVCSRPGEGHDPLRSLTLTIQGSLHKLVIPSPSPQRHLLSRSGFPQPHLTS